MASWYVKRHNGPAASFQQIYLNSLFFSQHETTERFCLLDSRSIPILVFFPNPSLHIYTIYPISISNFISVFQANVILTALVSKLISSLKFSESSSHFPNTDTNVHLFSHMKKINYSQSY